MIDTIKGLQRDGIIKMRKPQGGGAGTPTPDSRQNSFPSDGSPPTPRLHRESHWVGLVPIVGLGLWK